MSFGSPVDTSPVASPYKTGPVSLSAPDLPTAKAPQRYAAAATSPRRDAWPRHLAALGFFLLLGVLATWPLALHALTSVPGFDSPSTRAGMADQDQALWAHWWLRETLFNQHTDLLRTDLLYWPYYRQGLSLILYDMQLLRTAIALPVQIILGLAAAYNFGIFLSFTLGGYGMFLLGRDRGLSCPASLFAGVVFVAGPYHLMQLLLETSLVAVEALPFAVLWTRRALAGERRSAIVLAALCIVWANLSSWYFGLYVLLALFVLAVGLAWRRRAGGWRQIRSIFARALFIGGLYGILYLPVLVPVLAEVLNAPPASRLFPFSASIRGASTPWFRLFLNDRNPITQPPIWLGSAFLGYTTIALAVWGTIRRWRRALPWLILFFVYLNLAMGPDLHGFGNVITINGQPVPLPYGLLLGLPGMNLIRAPGHANVMILLCVGMLAGLGLDALARLMRFPNSQATRTVPALLASTAILLSLAEYLVLPLPLYELHWPAAFQQIGQDNATYGILELPITLHASNDHHRMFNQIAHHKGIAGGYLPRPIPDPYRLPDSPFARFTQPYTTTDVLAQDESQATDALLQLYDFRYLAIYHDRKDYRVDDSPWSWPYPTQPLEDPEITVYPARQAALDHTYLYLGNSWSIPERDGNGARRWLNGDSGYMLAWSPGEQGQLALDLELAPSAPAVSLQLSLDDRSILSFGIETLSPTHHMSTPPIELTRGWHRFKLYTLTPATPSALGTSHAIAIRLARWDKSQ